MSEPDASAERAGPTAPKRRGRVKKKHTVGKVLLGVSLALALVTGLGVAFLYRHLNGNLSELDVTAQLDGGSLAADGPEGDGLLSLDVGTPLTDVLAGEGGGAEGESAAGEGASCDEGGDDQSALQIGLDTDLAQGDLAEVDLSLLDLEVMVELGTGATALELGLPDVCDIIDAGQTVICALDSLTPSNIGLLLDTAGADTGATVTVSQGDRTVDVKTVDVLDTVGDLAGGVLGSSPTTGVVDPLASLLP